MFKNYLLTAIRNIIKNKQLTIFNILGLSFSMSVCLLIIVIIQDQYSYDNMHSERHKIYRIQSIDNKSKYALNKFASTTYPLADELANKYTLVDKIAVINNSFGGEAKFEDSFIYLTGYYTDQRFFEVFDFNLVRGNSDEVLSEPFSIVMRDDIAEKFFGDEDPLGKVISIEDYGNLRVTGIIEKPDSKSHINFESLVSSSTLRTRADIQNTLPIADDWDNYYSSYIYMIPVKGSDTDHIQDVLNKISEEKYKNNEKVNVSFYLNPFNNIVPGAVLGNEISMFMPKVYLIFFTTLAIIIILSASFNYTSLSIARSLTRLREFGMRKTLGSGKGQIITQILLEAVLIAIMSLIIAIGLLQFILPAFRGMKFMTLLEVSPDQNFTVYLWFLIFAVCTGIIAGMIPSLYVSRVKPVTVFRGAGSLKILKRLTVRRVLLVIQYIFSIILIITIILVYRQMIYMTNTEMGFDRDHVYNIRLNGKEFDLIKENFSKFPEVISIAGASHVPGIGNLRDTEIKLEEEDEPINAHYFSISPSYISTMGLKIIAGEDFPRNINNENELFTIVSELAVNAFNLGSPAEAIGRNLIVEDSLNLKIIGVVEDYKYCALFLPFRPLILRVTPQDLRVAALRINTINLAATVKKFAEEWDKIDPYHQMEGMLLDEEIRDYYSYFEDIIYTLGFVTLISIIIASLGLLGMATYSIETRTKEVGIRKVFGAKSHEILYTFAWSSIKALVIAAIISIPLAYLGNNLWLEYMPLHVSFGAGTIIAGVMVVLIIGALSILSQTMKASNTNPADTLKYE
ncbi:MAG: ABC transporter permease [Bacteroidales bacterium]|nr:ABC transporter permease [Bacteroidales bacterium]